MIDLIAGKIIKRTENYLTVMPDGGGVGIRVYVPKTVISNLQSSDVRLHTHLIVRETELTLYGFGSEEERSVFEILIKVNGVGPKVAIAILSTLSIDQLRHAVARETPDVITRAPGIGKKTAGKIVLELKDKLGWDVVLDMAPILISQTDEDVLATLTALGYSIAEAQTAMQQIPPDAPDDVEERVRIALQYFA